MNQLSFEKILPLSLMFCVTGATFILPFICLTCKKLKLKKDMLFIAYWFQTWIYLCFIPLLNCMFPNSSFAYPTALAELRVIQFTDEEINLYALFQSLLFILFYLPMLFFYKSTLLIKNMNERNMYNNLTSMFIKSPLNQLRKTDICKGRTSFKRLFLLCLFYSIFAMIYSIVVFETGLLNAYAFGDNIELYTEMNQFYRVAWKLYNLSAPFILVVLIVSYYERQWTGKYKSILFMLAIFPGILIQFASFLISSRSQIIFFLVILYIVMYIRGNIKIYTKKSALIIMALLLIGFYSFKVVPNLRGIVLQPILTSTDVIEALNPFSSKVDRLQSGIGFRADGIELMVLAKPYIVKEGFVPLSWYAVTFINPILPMFPELEKRLKVDDVISDFKRRYLKEYTPVTTSDYNAVSFTELFMLMGPLGFLIAAVLYGKIVKWSSFLIRKNNYYLIIGIFVVFQFFIFELPISGALIGWVRSLPILLIVLLLNPWSTYNTSPKASAK